MRGQKQPGLGPELRRGSNVVVIAFIRALDENGLRR